MSRAGRHYAFCLPDIAGLSDSPFKGSLNKSPSLNINTPSKDVKRVGIKCVLCSFWVYKSDLNNQCPGEIHMVMDLMFCYLFSIHNIKYLNEAFIVVLRVVKYLLKKTLFCVGGEIFQSLLFGGEGRLVSFFTQDLTH